MDANHVAREAMVAIAEDVLPGVLATVATERSLKVPPPRKVYRGVVEQDNLKTAFPNIEVTQPSGPVVITGRQTASQLSLWVMASVSCANPEQADEQCSAYLTALMRAYRYNSLAGGEAELVEIDASPPLSSGTQTVQTVGVRVLVSLVE